MDCRPDEKFYLDDTEFYALLAAVGKTTWYGLENLSKQINNNDDVNSILSKLYQNERIDWEGNRAKLKEPFKSIFKILAKSNICINVLIKKDFQMHNCYFRGNYVVTITRSRRDMHMMVLEVMEKNEWMENLKLFSFPEKIMEKPLSMKREYEMFLPEQSPFVYLGEEDIVSVLEKINMETGIVEERLLVRDVGICAELYLQAKGIYKCAMCEKDIWVDILKKWMKSNNEGETK